MALCAYRCSDPPALFLVSPLTTFAHRGKPSPMIDLSPPAALLLQVSGVLYGLLLAYYAFALDRVTRSIRENSNRLKGWQRRSFARESTDPRPSRTEWEAFVKGERREHTRRILLALSVFGS